MSSRAAQIGNLLPQRPIDYLTLGSAYRFEERAMGRRKVIPGKVHDLLCSLKIALT